MGDCFCNQFHSQFLLFVFYTCSVIQTVDKGSFLDMLRGGGTPGTSKKTSNKRSPQAVEVSHPCGNSVLKHTRVHHDTMILATEVMIYVTWW